MEKALTERAPLALSPRDPARHAAQLTATTEASGLASGSRYRAMIGTGGIGTGTFFQLEGSHTLGREESRTGRFLARRDYCKLHIVSHYVARLLGESFVVLPIGRVGADEAGERLLAEMDKTSLDTRYVERIPGLPTLSAICLVYPDGGGGNLTNGDSASARVDAESVSAAMSDFARFAGQGIAVALPEVPLATRRRLLIQGTQHGFLRVASFNSMELRQLREAGQLDGKRDHVGWLEHIDLLALNRDEAAALVGLRTEEMSAASVVDAAVSLLGSLRHPVMITITAGRQGSWSFDGDKLHHLRAVPVPVQSTAGAGDAHLAGTIAGLARDLSLIESHELGVLVAAMSVTSPHTIHDAISRVTLRSFARDLGLRISPAVAAFLEES